MENENKEFEQPSPVVIPEEAEPVVEETPAVEIPEPVQEPAPAPVAEIPEPVAEPSVADIPPVEVTSPEMNKVEEPVEKPTVVPTDEKKKSPIGGVLAVVLVLVLLVGGGYFYLRMTHTGEKFLEASFNKAVNLVKETYNLVKDVDYNVSDYKISGDAKLTTSGEGLELLNNVTLNYNFDMSLKNEYIYAKAKLTQDNVTTDLTGTIDGNVIYANLGDLYSKTIKYTSEENPFTSMKEALAEADTNATMADFEYMLEKMIGYSKEALLLSTITTNYDGLNVTYKYVVNDSNKEKINNKFAELVKADERLMKLLENEVPTLVDGDTTLTITSNLITNELEDFDVVSEDSKVKVSKKEKDHYVAELDDGDDKYTLDITKKGEEYTIKIKDADGKDAGTLVVSEKGNTTHVVYSYKDEQYDASVAMDLTMKSVSKYEIKVSVAAIIDSNKVNLDVTMETETKEGLVTKTIPDNTINVEEMGTELETLEEKLMTRLNEYKFYTLIEAMSEQEMDYDYAE